MIKIGMMIGDRYEILEKIGTGGMSDVYKAKCHKLNRFVAVKVLKQEFSENANFVSKFRIEAQAAAGLMHPNIVNVYDVGEENGIYYIVMELVEGITLKKYIEKKARISFKEAVSIAIQVCMGIEAAHNNNIIHRDIKPQNIIISREGKVKVTDFGIAKAATSNTITSNVMGSVHYTSPEQARGGYSDEKSDIYSLGITMFEMLTGRVPFNGETTVAIAIKHIQEEIPSPKEYVPEIPASVDGIVLKCCHKSPDRRYQNMQELIADLKQSLMNPDEDFVTQNEPDLGGGTRMISDTEIARIKSRTAYVDNREYPEYEEGMRLKSDTDSFYNDYDEEGDVPEADNYNYSPRMERVTTWLTIIAGIVICIIIVILLVNIFGKVGKNTDNDPSGPTSPIVSGDESTEPTTEYVEMPNVIGWNVEDARNALQEQGVIPEIEYEESATVDEDVVIRASVNPGSRLVLGNTVKLYVSMGPKPVEVPNVEGLTYEAANSKLLNSGFSVNKEEAFSDTVEAGVVISQTPDGEEMRPRGIVVTVTVSKGKEIVKVRVPNLIGKSEADGTIEATEAELVIGDIARVYSEEVPAGYICYQSCSHGSYVDVGTVIDIKISMGTQTVSYKCNASIAAPTLEEAPDYVAGTEVDVMLITDDGQVLLDTVYTSFPQAANYTGLTSAGGTLTMSYTVTTDGSTTTNPETGEIINVPGTQETKTFTRRIEFVEE